MAITLDLAPRLVPLIRSEDGVYRVIGSGLPLERIVEHYKAGATPEEIVESFDILGLSDVYTLIGYYLAHREEVEAYLREQDEGAEAVRREIEAAQPPRPGFKEELLRRKALLEKREAPASHGRGRQRQVLPSIALTSAGIGYRAGPGRRTAHGNGSTSP
ncbi:MAG TPA: DUF433 domain-containing protein [Gemmataceae bacterium]|nr:DUF433 domain-containing protein [Gemmataceae bacterium]